MVTAEISIPGETGRLTLQPNHSLSWGGNLGVFLSLLMVSVIISVGFVLMGAWVIIPFMGLELLLLGLALYYVCHQLQQMEVISVHHQEVVVEKGRSQPQQLWVFQRPNIQVVVPGDVENPKAYPISFSGDQGLLEIGKFLGTEDRQALLKGLLRCGLRTTKQGSWCSYGF